MLEKSPGSPGAARCDHASDCGCAALLLDFRGPHFAGPLFHDYDPGVVTRGIAHYAPDWRASSIRFPNVVQLIHQIDSFATQEYWKYDRETCLWRMDRHVATGS